MELNLKIKKIERLEAKGRGVVGIYNLVLDGTTETGDDPTIRGLRLFRSDKDGTYYLRLPQIQLKNGRSFNIIKLPKDVFRQLEGLLTKDYLNPSRRSDLTEENIESVTF